MMNNYIIHLLLFIFKIIYCTNTFIAYSPCSRHGETTTKKLYNTKENNKKKKNIYFYYSIDILFILGVRFWPPHQNMLTFTTIIGEFTC